MQHNDTPTPRTFAEAYNDLLLAQMRAWHDDPAFQLAVRLGEAKAMRIRAELGDAEIERRTKARQESWAREQKEWNEYRREVKATRARHAGLQRLANVWSAVRAWWREWRPELQRSTARAYSHRRA